jgi:hypothetical protein
MLFRLIPHVDTSSPLTVQQEETKFDFNTSRLIHNVDPQGGLAMQHDEKLGTMKLIMLHHEGGPNGYNILILIRVWRGVSKRVKMAEDHPPCKQATPEMAVRLFEGWPARRA